MKKTLNLVLKNVGLLAVFVLFLSANTTSGWVAHQPEIPDDIKKFKI
ncbi:cyclic lactone autoinducer peptide [Clostridioides sp. ES-S-0001-02]|nr:cyclic lactone autoinducer peptide [Clostridioides sp. ES-S-0001-02]